MEYYVIVLAVWQDYILCHPMLAIVSLDKEKTTYTTELN